jgi:preprotein translocase subunit SecE
MARDRKKAKARRARQERQQRSGGSGQRQQRQPRQERPGEPGGNEPTGFDPLGPLGRKPGDVELAEEAEEGLPVDEADAPTEHPGGGEIYEDELDDDAAGHGVLSQLVDRDEDLGIEEDEVDPELEEQAEAAATATGRRPKREAKAAKPEGNRVFAFLRACWAELQRVQWPDRRAVFQATAVVLSFVIIAGSYLGLMDFIWSKVITALLDL